MIIKPDQEELFDVLNVVSFSEAVERHYIDNKIPMYSTAILDMMEEMDIEEKDVVKLISSTLKEKLRIESEEEGLLFKDDEPMMTF